MKSKKKIAIVGTAGVPARYGGFETLAHHLVLNLSDQYDIHVYASGKMYKKEERVKTWEGATVHYLPLSANGASSIPYDMISMLHAITYADYVLVLGVSGGMFIPFIKFFTRARVIVNIDGLEWRRNKWNKWAKRFLKLSERVAVRYSDADITDNEAIKRYTAVHYKTASHLIAYGADHAKPKKLTKTDFRKYPFLRGAYAFKVARIEPENNVEMILSAFTHLTNKQLVVVGNWNNSEYGRNLVKTYGKYANIHLLDPIYEQTELDKLRSNCYVYLHGHSAGGTNPSLVEAMHLGLPVVAYDVSYNRATMQNEGLYFGSEEALITLMNNINLAQLKSIAVTLEKIAKFKYTWTFISQRYASIFKAFEFNYVKPKIQQKNTAMGYEDLLKNGYAHLDHTKLFFELNPKK